MGKPVVPPNPNLPDIVMGPNWAKYLILLIESPVLNKGTGPFFAFARFSVERLLFNLPPMRPHLPGFPSFLVLT